MVGSLHPLWKSQPIDVLKCAGGERGSEESQASGHHNTHLKHVERRQLDPRPFFWRIHLGPLENNCVGRKVDTPCKRSGRHQDLQASKMSTKKKKNENAGNEHLLACCGWFSDVSNKIKIWNLQKKKKKKLPIFCLSSYFPNGKTQHGKN